MILQKLTVNKIIWITAEITKTHGGNAPGDCIIVMFKI